MMIANRQIKPRRILLYATLVILAMIYMMPVYMVTVTAFKDPANINLETAWNPPNPIDWEGFYTALKEFLPNLKNSFLQP